MQAMWPEIRAGSASVCSPYAEKTSCAEKSPCAEKIREHCIVLTQSSWLACRQSIALSRAGSSFLDDDLLEATAQAAGMAVRERRSGTVTPCLPDAARKSARDSSLDSQEGPGAAGGPVPKALTLEDSAEIEGTTLAPPAVKVPPPRSPADETFVSEGGPPARPTQKAKQPSCGCTIC